MKWNYSHPKGRLPVPDIDINKSVEDELTQLPKQISGEKAARHPRLVGVVEALDHRPRGGRLLGFRGNCSTEPTHLRQEEFQYE